MARYVRTVAPALVVTLDECKDHLRVDHGDEDDLIGAYLSAAIDHLDGRTGILGRALGEQAWRLTMDRFPAGPIAVGITPVVSVSSISYLSGGVTTALASDRYSLDTGVVSPVSSWPVADVATDAVTIEFVAGEGCPPAIRAAILLLVGHWYANREAVTSPLATLPMAISALVTPWRRVGL